MISLCNDWEFTPEWTDGFARGDGSAYACRINRMSCRCTTAGRRIMKLSAATASACSSPRAAAASDCSCNLTARRITRGYMSTARSPRSTAAATRRSGSR